jgi:hypothetical protein
MYDSLRQPGINALRQAHTDLDRAVLQCYGFDARNDVLKQLLDLNHRLAESERAGLAVQGAGPPSSVGVRRTDDRVDAPAPE